MGFLVGGIIVALIIAAIRGAGTGYVREVAPHLEKAMDDRNERDRIQAEAKTKADAHAAAVAHSQRQKQLDRERFGYSHGVKKDK